MNYTSAYINILEIFLIEFFNLKYFPKISCVELCCVGGWRERVAGRGGKY